MKLAIVGATGVTGGLAFDIAESKGLKPLAVGRNALKVQSFLQTRGLGTERMRTADVHDAAALRSAIDGVRCVVSTVAPFAQHGFPVAQAAADLGIGYLDSTGEGKFAKRIADELDAKAKGTGATLCPGTGASAFLGDVGIRMLLLQHPGARTGGVLYDIRKYQPTFGSLISYLTSILPGGGPSLRDGTLGFLPFGAYNGAIAGIPGFHGVMIDPAVIARYWQPLSFDALMKGSHAARPMIRATMALLATRPMRAVLMRFPLQKMAAFDALVDGRASVTVHAEVIDEEKISHRVSLQGDSVYRLTAAVLIASAQALLEHPRPPTGVRAASELFDSLDHALQLSGVRRVP